MIKQLNLLILGIDLNGSKVLHESDWKIWDCFGDLHRRDDWKEKDLSQHFGTMLPLLEKKLIRLIEQALEIKFNIERTIKHDCQSLNNYLGNCFEWSKKEWLKSLTRHSSSAQIRRLMRRRFIQIFWWIVVVLWNFKRKPSLSVKYSKIKSNGKMLQCAIQDSLIFFIDL